MTVLSRRQLLAASAALGAAGAVGASPVTPATAAPRTRRPIDPRRIRRWAADTWASLVAMTDEGTGLTADNIGASVSDPVRSGYTSPTNIGGYLWSAVVARDLGLISGREASGRIAETLSTLLQMERHQPSGMFYNWYDEESARVLTTWPVDGSRVYPFLSSVDNGWLAAALMVVGNADRSTRGLADRVLRRMNFKVFYNPDAGQPEIDGSGHSGLMKGGFWDGEPKPGEATQVGNFLGRGPDVTYTAFHYDTTVSETRIASYIAIARRQVPAKLYFGTWRTFPATEDWSWHEQQPTGRYRTYLGIRVYEGVYEHLGHKVVPGWGGSMFEALMPDMFVPEERWSPRAWGPNHRNTVAIHRLHGLEEAGYGFWGFSPSSEPGGGYREYGVDAIGLNPEGYFSDVEKTNFDKGFGTFRSGLNPDPTYGDGVVTPHALFLAMHHEPRQAYENLVALARAHDAYGEGGFYDAIAVRTGTVASRYLSLDQAMVMGSIGNVFGGGAVRRYFAVGEVERRIRPLLAMERFSL